MRLLDIITRDRVVLDLAADGRDAALTALVTRLDLAGQPSGPLTDRLIRREDLSSTGLGHGLAVPHSRSAAVSGIQLVYGRHTRGLPWQAIDGLPVRHLFLIVAPTGESAGSWLALLARLARLARHPSTVRSLDQITSVDEFLGFLEDEDT